MITQGMCAAFTLACIEGVHQPGDDYRIALFTAAADLSPLTTVYDPTNEVVAPGYTAGGILLTGRVASLAGTTAIVDFDDVSWPASTITARGALIYNATRGNAACTVYNFGRDVTSTNGVFDVTMPAPTALTAVLRLRLP